MILQKQTYTISKTRHTNWHYRMSETGPIVASIYYNGDHINHKNKHISAAYHAYAGMLRSRAHTFKTLREAKADLRKQLINTAKLYLKEAENIR